MARDIVKRHLNQINRSFRRYQRTVGQIVTWYEWDPTSSGVTGTYDEGSRGWKPPRPMPILHLVRDEEEQVPREEGFITTGRVHLTASPEQLRRAGMSDPYDSRRHLHDRFLWDNEVWEVRTWRLQGRLVNFETVIGIDAQRVAPEEMYNDPQADWAIYTQPD